VAQSSACLATPFQELKIVLLTLFKVEHELYHRGVEEDYAVWTRLNEDEALRARKEEYTVNSGDNGPSLVCTRCGVKMLWRDLGPHLSSK
jgi:hypothetical protein